MSGKSFTDSINQTGLSNKGINALFKPSEEPKPSEAHVPSNSTLTTSKSTEKPKKQKQKKTRASFYLNVSTLETLKDFVYMQRIKGKVYYTQYDAIEYALRLLFETVDTIPKRPADLED